MSGPLICARYDPSYTYMASVIQALDQHQIRVESLVLSQDLLSTLLTLNKGAKLSTLEWISSDRIALCQTNGTVLIYSPSSNSIEGELESPTSVAISDFHFSPVTHTAWVSDISGTVFEWDLQDFKLLQKFALSDMLDTTEKISKLSSTSYDDEAHLLIGTHNVYLVDIFAKKIVKTFPAHVQPITALMPVPGNSDLFITSAEEDRFANIYSIAKGSTKAVLAAQSPIQQVAVGVHENDSIVAVIVEDRSLEIFKDPFCFEASPQETSRKKRKQLASMVQSKHSDASLKFARPEDEVRGPDDENLPLSAVAATDSVLHVSWLENASISRFDTLPWLTASGEFAFSGSKTIRRSKQQIKQPSRTEKGHDSAAGRHYSEIHTVITEGTAFQNDLETGDDDEEEESLADRLNKLNGGNSTKEEVGKKRLNRHTSGTLTVVLSQALRNNDHSLLETVLCNRDPSVIQKTINRLDSSLAIILLDRLAERLTRQQLRFEQLNFWLKWIIIIHGGVLSSMPNMSNKLASLHAILTKKAQQLPRLLELQGRLNMMQQQNHLRKEILDGSVVQDDYDDADTDVEYVEEVDDAIEAGLIDSDEDLDMEAADDYDEMMDEEDEGEEVAEGDLAEDEDGLSDVETAVEKNDVFEE